MIWRSLIKMKDKNNINVMGFVKDTVNTAIDSEMKRHDDQIKTVLLLKTVRTLYDAKVKDSEIIRVLNKYWGVNYNDAIRLIENEKTIFHPVESVVEYLVDSKHMSIDEAKQWTYEHKVEKYLKLHSEAWKLNIKDLLKEIDNEK